MTQHEYIFIAISIVLGLAMARLLHTAALLVRAHSRVTFHWSTVLWSACILVYILQLWWVGWELRLVSDWSIVDFFVLVTGAILVYGAAELALPTEDFDITDNTELDFLVHSRSFGRVSAASMLGYFAVGPYVNLTMFGNPPLPSPGLHPDHRGPLPAVPGLRRGPRAGPAHGRHDHEATVVQVTVGTVCLLHGLDSVSHRVKTRGDPGPNDRRARLRSVATVSPGFRQFPPRISARRPS